MKKKFTKCKATTVLPTNHSRLIYNDYDIQNMLVVQRDFPSFYYKGKGGDFVGSLYTDRADRELWKEAVKNFKSVTRNCDYWDNIDTKELMEFANILWAGHTDGIIITGVRIVRYTDAGQFPVWRIDVFGKSSETPCNHDFCVAYDEEYLEKQWEKEQRRALSEGIIIGGNWKDRC